MKNVRASSHSLTKQLLAINSDAAAEQPREFKQAPTARNRGTPRTAGGSELEPADPPGSHRVPTKRGNNGCSQTQGFSPLTANILNTTTRPVQIDGPSSSAGQPDALRGPRKQARKATTLSHALRTLLAMMR